MKEMSEDEKRKKKRKENQDEMVNIVEKIKKHKD